MACPRLLAYSVYVTVEPRLLGYGGKIPVDSRL